MIFFNTIKRVFKKVRRIFSLSFEKNHLIKRQKQTGRADFNIFLTFIDENGNFCTASRGQKKEKAPQTFKGL